MAFALLTLAISSQTALPLYQAPFSALSPFNSKLSLSVLNSLTLHIRLFPAIFILAGTSLAYHFLNPSIPSLTAFSPSQFLTLIFSIQSDHIFSLPPAIFFFP
jgi:hypothetical protein